MKSSTKKVYSIGGEVVSPQKFYANERKVAKAKKDARRINKSARQKVRRLGQRLVRSGKAGGIPWMRGNPPKFGTKAAAKLKVNKEYAFHAAFRVTGDLSSSRGLGAIRDWYATNTDYDFDKQATGSGYTIYPFLGNFTPEEMAMIPEGDTRTNAEIRIQAVIADLVGRGAETVDSKGVFVSGVMGGGKGMR